MTAAVKDVLERDDRRGEANASRHPGLFGGRVVDAHEDGQVHIQAGTFFGPARVARSCLVAPRRDDAVLLADVRGETWILAILEGREGSTTVAVDGDLHLASRTGRVKVVGAEGVDLQGDEVVATARRISLAANTVEATSRVIQIVADKALTRLGRVRTIADSLDSIVGRITLRASDSLRTIAGIDQTRARQVDMTASGTVVIRGEHAALTSACLTKIDGAQVQVG